MKKLIILLLLTILSNQLKAQNSEDSIIAALKRSHKLSKFDKSDIQIKFNNDTIIVAGYLADLSNPKPRYEQKKNIVYKTSNGGLNWKKIRFKGDAWIYDAFHSKDGKIWMGGSDNYIHYSNDFGENWIKKPKPFNPVNRVLSIFMVDTLNGIAGGLSNGLAITEDNWNTSKQIESPIDQGKFKILNPSARDRVDEIAIVDSIVLINQNGYIFYSKRDTIDWTKFNIPVSGFSINEEKSEITLHSRNGKNFILDRKLNLIKEMQEDFLLQSVINDSTRLNLNSFFESEISSIIITSSKRKFEKQVHIPGDYKYDIQKGEILDKKGVTFFKAKGFDKKSLAISKDSIKALLQDKNLKLELSDLSKHLTFTTIDFNQYEKFVEDVLKERAEKKNWGGNSTSLIEISNPKFRDFQNQSTYIKQNYISSIFNRINLQFLFRKEEREFIELQIENKNGDKIIIDNKKAEFYSLPWTITDGNKSMDTYNPKITELVRRILPTKFNNYEKLLGGELIFRLIEEDIIDNLVYVNGY